MIVMILLVVVIIIGPADTIVMNVACAIYDDISMNIAEGRVNASVCAQPIEVLCNPSC